MQGKGKAELPAFQIHTRKASIVNNQGDSVEKRTSAQGHLKAEFTDLYIVDLAG